MENQQTNNKYTIIVIILYLLVIHFPLTIAEIVVGAIQPGTCDNLDVMGLKVSQWLLGFGIANLITGVVAFGMITMTACGIITIELNNKLTNKITLVGLIFSFVWFIIGAVVLFRSNLDCIRLGSSHVVFSLVLWCLLMICIIYQLCTYRIKLSTQNNV